MLFGRNVTFKLLDGFVFETAGPEGIRTSLGNMAVGSTRFQNGFIPNYASIFLFGALSLVGGFVLMPKVVTLLPFLEIYSSLFLQLLPVLVAVVT